MHRVSVSRLKEIGSELEHGMRDSARRELLSEAARAYGLSIVEVSSFRVRDTQPHFVGFFTYEYPNGHRASVNNEYRYLDRFELTLLENRITLLNWRGRLVPYLPTTAPEDAVYKSLTAHEVNTLLQAVRRLPPVHGRVTHELVDHRGNRYEAWTRDGGGGVLLSELMRDAP